MISGIFRAIIWNQTIPDHLRGRLAGIEMVSDTTGPLLGNIESGLTAAVFSVRTSIVSGGVLCIVGTACWHSRCPPSWPTTGDRDSPESRRRTPLARLRG